MLTKAERQYASAKALEAQRIREAVKSEERSVLRSSLLSEIRYGLTEADLRNAIADFLEEFT